MPAVGWDNGFDAGGLVGDVKLPVKYSIFIARFDEEADKVTRQSVDRRILANEPRC